MKFEHVLHYKDIPINPFPTCLSGVYTGCLFSPGTVLGSGVLSVHRILQNPKKTHVRDSPLCSPWSLLAEPWILPCKPGSLPCRHLGKRLSSPEADLPWVLIWHSWACSSRSSVCYLFLPPGVPSAWHSFGIFCVFLLGPFSTSSTRNSVPETERAPSFSEW